MGAVRIFSKFKDLLDIKVIRPFSSWIRLNTDGTFSERTAAETREDLEINWVNLDGKPSDFNPSSHGHTWSEIEEKPLSFPPESHEHNWSEIQDKPLSFSPSAHTHPWGEITGKPSLMEEMDISSFSPISPDEYPLDPYLLMAWAKAFVVFNPSGIRFPVIYEISPWDGLTSGEWGNALGDNLVFNVGMDSWVFTHASDGGQVYISGNVLGVHPLILEWGVIHYINFIPAPFSGFRLPHDDNKGRVLATLESETAEAVDTERNQLIAGQKTFLDSIESQGSNNLMSNQVLSSPYSVMNFDLSRIRQIMNCITGIPGGGVNLLGATGTTGWSSTANGLRLDSAGTGGFGAISLNVGNITGGLEIHIGNRTAGGNFGYLSFNSRMKIGVRICSGGNNGVFSPSVQSWAWVLGAMQTAPTSSIATITPSGTNASHGYVGLTCINGEVKLVVQAGVGAPQYSGVLETITGSFMRQYVIVVDSGTAYLYINGVLAGSRTGAPTGDLGGAAGGFCVNHTSTQAASATQRRLNILNYSVAWD